MRMAIRWHCLQRIFSSGRSASFAAGIRRRNGSSLRRHGDFWRARGRLLDVDVTGAIVSHPEGKNRGGKPRNENTRLNFTWLVCFGNERC